MIRSTYTFAALEVSAAAYDEIKAKLEDAGYQHTFGHGSGAIDMHGIGLTRAVEATASEPIECGLVMDGYRVVFEYAGAHIANAKGDVGNRLYLAREALDRWMKEWLGRVAALESALLTAEENRAKAEQEREALRRMLETSTVRLGILRDRMENCDNARRPRERLHKLSLFEVPAWIDEQAAAALRPDGG